MTRGKFQGTCSTEVSYQVDTSGLVHNVVFTGGCEGNLQAIAKLVEGRSAGEIITLLDGLTCGRKATSCADQFARVLKEGYCPKGCDR